MHQYDGGVLENLVDDAYGVHNEAPGGEGSGANNSQVDTVPETSFSHGLDHVDKYYEYKRIASEKL